MITYLLRSVTYFRLSVQSNWDRSFAPQISQVLDVRTWPKAAS